MNFQDWLIVIPARISSQRLLRKPLQDLGGKALIIRVFENIEILKTLGSQVLIATDSQEILETCRQEDVPCQLTSCEHKSGTDRCLEVALQYPHPYIMNIQGDEPFLKTSDLKKLAKSLEESKEVAIATLAYPKISQAEWASPNTVKVVGDKKDHALYFSRSPIPYPQIGASTNTKQAAKHIGVYAYKRQCLIDFCSLSTSPLEELEKLEQLRALENQMKILLVYSEHPSLGIDTEEDLKEAREAFAKS